MDMISIDHKRELITPMTNAAMTRFGIHKALKQAKPTISHEGGGRSDTCYGY
jgi:hypothetical protein